MIEVTLHETGLSLLANFAGAALMTDQALTRSGNTNQVVQPAGIYEAADGPFMVTVVNDSQFRSLCQNVIEQPHLASDTRFADNSGRVRNGGELRDILGEHFRKANRSTWVALLRKFGVPAGSVATVRETLSSELVAAREAVRHVKHTTAGPYPVLRPPARFHETADVADHGAPLLGEHTRDVLRHTAGLDDTEIDALVAQGAARCVT